MIRRTTIAPGIRRDASGYEAAVKIRGERRYQRFPLSTPIHEMQAWQRAERTRVQRAAPLLDQAGPGTPGRPPASTLEAASERFLPQIAGRASFKADRSHLRAWYGIPGHHGRPLGSVAPTLITTEDVNLAIAQWQTAAPRRAVRRIRVTGYARESVSAAQQRRTAQIQSYDRQTPITSGQVVAAKTIRHRCRVLDELYRTLAIASPVAGAKIPKLPKPHPIGVPIEIVRQVAQALARASDDSPEDAHTYARFAVLVTTGQRPCQVMRTQPGDLDLTDRVWLVRSAKNEPAHTITLNAEMVAAWEAFIAAAAWGSYDTTLHARRVHAAGWPKGIRPYAARHSVMMAALAAGVPLDEVQGLAGHTSPLTTRQFYGPIVVSRQRRASDLLQGRLAGVFGPRLATSGGDVLPPGFTTRDTGKGRK